MGDMFTMLAVVLALAGLGGLIAKLFRQPMIVGYVLAGLVFSGVGRWVGVGEGESKQVMELMGKFGVTLLLFLVGLELPMIELKHLGKVALVAGGCQIVFTSSIGYLLGIVLGFDTVAALYLAVAVTFSSTIVVVKLLSEKKDLLSLHGRMATGILLVQDFVAIGILAVLSGFGVHGFSWGSLIGAVIKTGILAGLAISLSGWVLPRVSSKIADSTELLFVVSLAWCFGYAAIAASPLIGLSSEMGGFLAGLAMANASEHLQIGSRLRPLRDFFLILFFVWLGSNMNLWGSEKLWWPAVVVAGFVLIVSPFILMTILGCFGFKRRTIFLTGLTMSQVSEFSLILATYGLNLGHITNGTLTVITLAGILTMVLSTYLISSGDKIYRKIAKYLSVFESKTVRLELKATKKGWNDHVILFGHNRTGGALRPVLSEMGMPLVVVDFNPVVVDQLAKEGVEAVYGDMSDYELYDEVGLDKARLVISTVPDLEDNLQLLYRISLAKTEKGSERKIVIVTAQDGTAAKQLYESGADYVLIPQSVGGEYLAGLLDAYGFDKTKISQRGKSHLHQIKAAADV